MRVRALLLAAVLAGPAMGDGHSDGLIQFQMQLDLARPGTATDLGQLMQQYRATPPGQQREFEFQYEGQAEDLALQYLEVLRRNQDGPGQMVDPGRLDAYAGFASRARLEDLPPAIATLNLDQYGMTPDQQNEIRRLLFVGIREIDPTTFGGCRTCAGTVSGPLGLPGLPGVPQGTTPTTQQYYGIAAGTFRGGDARMEIRNQTADPDNFEDWVRRTALLTHAVQELVSRTGRADHDPHIEFVADTPTGIWQSTSVVVVVESEVLDPADTNHWVGFQVTLQEPRSDIMGAGITGDEAQLIVDGYVRRRRALFTFSETAVPLDEDFGRVVEDIAESNRREQVLADQIYALIVGG